MESVLTEYVGPNWQVCPVGLVWDGAAINRTPGEQMQHPRKRRAARHK